MTAIKQASFVGGEWTPSLHARTDLARYQQALALCSNWIVRQHGGIANRPGTRFVRAARGPCVLVPFCYSNAVTYMLEMGTDYVRVHRDGETVLDPATGAPYEAAIEPPWAVDELAQVQFAQLADTITFVHPNHPPRELQRYGHADWRWRTVTVTRTIQPPASVSVAPYDAHYTPSTGDQHIYREWSWGVTAVSATGEESLPRLVGPVSLCLYGDMPARLSWPAVTGAVSYNVYRGRNDVLGFVGSTTKTVSGTVVFDDDAALPATSSTPPQGSDPFASAGNYPSTVVYHEQRRFYGGTSSKPQTIFGTQIGNYYSFDKGSPANADDALELTLASRGFDEIRALVSFQKLVVLTAAAEYTIDGGTGAIAPNAYQIRTQSYRGSSRLSPIQVGDVCLFVQEKQSVVRDLFYQFANDAWGGTDLTVLAEHLLRGRQIVSWTYQQIPLSVVWCVRDDGVLLGLTYLREHDVWAWHRHATDGFVERVCAVSEGTEDALYLVVRRTVGGVERRFVERMASRTVLDVRDGLFLDCAVSYDGRRTTALSFLASGAQPAGATFLVDAAADVFGPGCVGGGVHVFGATTERATIVEYSGARQVRVRAETPWSAETIDGGTADWGLAATRLVGADHLEGRTVSILADGSVHPERVVANGGVVLAAPAVVVHAGLPYRSDAETLPFAPPTQEATRQRRKVVHHVSLEVEETRSLRIGEPGGEQLEWVPTYEELDGEPRGPATGLVNVPIAGSWNREGRVRISQTEPLPATVLSAIPEASVAG